MHGIIELLGHTADDDISDGGKMATVTFLLLDVLYDNVVEGLDISDILATVADQSWNKQCSCDMGRPVASALFLRE